jgi:hypothetical protein
MERDRPMSTKPMKPDPHATFPKDEVLEFLLRYLADANLLDSLTAKKGSGLRAYAPYESADVRRPTVQLQDRLPQLIVVVQDQVKAATSPDELWALRQRLQQGKPPSAPAGGR